MNLIMLYLSIETAIQSLAHLLYIFDVGHHKMRKAKGLAFNSNYPG